jgi:hypothetical protein
MYLLGVILLLGIALVIALLVGEIRQRKTGTSLLPPRRYRLRLLAGGLLILLLLAIEVGALGLRLTTAADRPLLFFGYWLICLLFACALVFLALFDLREIQKMQHRDINDLWQDLGKILSQGKDKKD